MRSFQLSDKINSEAISATYAAGILTIVLPKHEDRVTQRREVTVEEVMSANRHFVGIFIRPIVGLCLRVEAFLLL